MFSRACRLALYVSLLPLTILLTYLLMWTMKQPPDTNIALAVVVSTLCAITILLICFILIHDYCWTASSDFTSYRLCDGQVVRDYDGLYSTQRQIYDIV